MNKSTVKLEEAYGGTRKWSSRYEAATYKTGLVERVKASFRPNVLVLRRGVVHLDVPTPRLVLFYWFQSGDGQSRSHCGLLVANSLAINIFSCPCRDRHGPVLPQCATRNVFFRWF